MAGPPDRRFPDPGFAPGEYSAEWRIGDRAIAGELSLAPLRFPSVTLYGGVAPLAARDSARAFPTNFEMGRLTGRLRSNHEVVILEAELSEWFPGQTFGGGEWAIVGLGVCEIPDDRYHCVSLQITDTDLLLGIPPLRNMEWPRPAPPKSPARSSTSRAKRSRSERRFSAAMNSRAHRVWRDPDAGVTLDVGYFWQSTIDPYRFGVTPAPVIDLKSRAPLTLNEWRDSWIVPLVGVASFATKRPQRVSWLRVIRGRGPKAVTGTVFSGGIEQAPYTAHYEIEWRADPDRQPLFTLGSEQVDAIGLIKTWRDLAAAENPFVELYRSTLFQPDLPPRARFLNLIQALEALHSYEHRSSDTRRQREFATRRAAVIQEAETFGLPPESIRFLKRGWSKKRRQSLEKRLHDLIKGLPQGTRAELETGSDLEPIRTALEGEDALTLAAQLRVLRNHLSHGNRSYADDDLRPWVGRLETLCRGHLLRLLGVP
jgi:hypothetical protein